MYLAHFCIWHISHNPRPCIASLSGLSPPITSATKITVTALVMYLYVLHPYTLTTMVHPQMEENQAARAKYDSIMKACSGDKAACRTSAQEALAKVKGATQDATQQKEAQVEAAAEATESAMNT